MGETASPAAPPSTSTDENPYSKIHPPIRPTFINLLARIIHDG